MVRRNRRHAHAKLVGGVFLHFYLWAAWRAWEEFRVARVLRRCLESGNLLPPRPGPFPPWRSVFRLALDLLVLCGLLWNLWRTITAL